MSERDMTLQLSQIDLAKYLDGQESMQLRSPSDLWKSLRSAMFGENAQGRSLPWLKAQGKFDIRPGELTIWTGYKGHGKSMCLSHVMIDLLSQGEIGCIISPEFRAQEVLRRKVLQLSCGPNPTEQFAKRSIDWMTGHLWVLDHQGMTPWQKVVGCLRYAYDKFGITQAVVDSLMKCGINPDDFAAQKAFVDRLQTFAHDTGCHVHLVAHARKGQDDSKPAELHDVKGTSEICDMAENVVSVWKNKRKFQQLSQGIESNEEDALFVVDSQRNYSWTGAFRLWWHPSGQFLEDSYAKPKGYVP